MYFHIVRGVYVICYQYNSNLWLSGVVLFVLVMVISFLGYVLVWGHMSFWGGTVISNVLCCVPCCVFVLLGGLYVCNASVRRFFVFHVLMSICVLLFVVVHVCYVHYVSSSNVLCLLYNNVCHLFPSVICKDVFVMFVVIVCVIVMVLFLGVYSLCHVDNSVEVNGLVTPFHIVPEWYLLCVFGVLKGIPHRVVGVLFMLLCIVCMLLFSEFKNVSTISRLF